MCVDQVDPELLVASFFLCFDELGEVDPVLQPSYVTGMELILFLKRNPKHFWKILDFF